MAAPRILWVSQIAAPEVRAGRLLPDERTTGPESLPGADVTVVDAPTEPLPPLSGFDAVVLGGSLGCVHDQEPWRCALTTWAAGLGDTPFLGICGGHQLLALVRGGAVVRGGHRQVGLFPLAVPGFGVGWVMHSHEDAVTTLPAGATEWARDEVCVQAVRYGRAQWTFQFHPEPSQDIAPFLWRSAGLDYPDHAVKAAVARGRRILAAWLAAVGGAPEPV